MVVVIIASIIFNAALIVPSVGGQVISAILYVVFTSPCIGWSTCKIPAADKIPTELDSLLRNGLLPLRWTAN